MGASSATTASLLNPPFLSSNYYRMSQMFIGIHSVQLPAHIISISLCLSNHNRKLANYVVDSGVFCCHTSVRCFATTGSLNLDSALERNVWGSSDSQRSSGKPEISKKSFDNDLELMLQDLFDEIKSLIRMGNNNDALELLEANYEVVKQQIEAGDKGIEQVAILDVIALGYVAIGDLKMVGFLLNLLNKVVKELMDDEPLLDSVLTHMGSMYTTLGKFESSMHVYKRALAIIEGRYGNNSTLLVTPLLGVGKVLGLIGRATKATDMYHRAITVLETNMGAESEQLVLPLFALGNLLMKEGKTTDAENAFNRTLNIYKKLYGEDDERVGMTLCSLANVKCAKGDVDEAILLYQNALLLLKNSKNVNSDDGVVEKIMIDLAELLHSVGRGDEGRTLLKECLLITEKHKGKEHPDSVSHLINLATSYSRSKNFVEAERLLRTSLKIMSKTVTPDDQSITFPKLNLAITLYNLNQNEEAEQLALEVLLIREKAFGKDSLPVGEALDCLVSIQSRMEKDDKELLGHLQRVLQIQEKAFGDDSEEVIGTLKKILFYLDKMGRKNEKFAVQKRLSMLRTKYKQMIQH
ncbi:uncharacterized protein LOC141708288 [Apium graveolens]|uniref:uncharacterized protein LOC141708288 n=1 Tax=Apium graveolens TaxID=4045 RepID=UPI003D79E6AE